VILQIHTVDAHVGGQPLRLVVGGAPRSVGASMARRSDWLRRHADYVRRALVLEPRGHGDMLAAQLTDAVAPGAHAGIVFMGAHGYPPLSAHGVIAAATIAVERELLPSRQDAGGEVPLTLDTAAGTIHARVRAHDRGGVARVDSVAFTNVPAFVHAAGQSLRIGTRELRVDIAYGGLFYAIVDTEAVGIPLSASRLPDLRRLAADIVSAANTAIEVHHPAVPSVAGVAGVVFTGPPQDPEAHLKAVTVTGGGAVDRSPGGTGMSAVMSVLDAMGLLPEVGAFVQEGLVGTIFHGRVAGRRQVGERPAIAVEIEGTAWITGEHTFLLDEDDPFREGVG
jgi:proline racemase